jgi:hypothetical protein
MMHAKYMVHEIHIKILLLPTSTLLCMHYVRVLALVMLYTTTPYCALLCMHISKVLALVMLVTLHRIHITTYVHI